MAVIAPDGISATSKVSLIVIHLNQYQLQHPTFLLSKISQLLLKMFLLKEIHSGDSLGRYLHVEHFQNRKSQG